MKQSYKKQKANILQFVFNFKSLFLNLIGNCEIKHPQVRELAEMLISRGNDHFWDKRSVFYANLLRSNAATIFESSESLLGLVLSTSLVEYNPVNLHFQVEDHDTPPEELHYLVISKPSNGYLTLGERLEPVTSFTQYDVNHGRLHFIQQVSPLRETHVSAGTVLWCVL